MKRLLTRGALLLLLCALLAASGFADVKAEAVCQQDVLFCTDEGLMTGTGRNTFSPDRPMTRAMLVTVLWRMAGSPEVTENASGSYYEAAVAWAAKNEIASGTSATTFEPNKAVTREQLAKFLFNYAVYQGMDAVTLSENLISFEDHVCVSGYAVSAMQWAVGRGLINGTDGKLLPTGTATRCQFAAILRRAKRHKHTSFLSPGRLAGRQFFCGFP